MHTYYNKYYNKYYRICVSCLKRSDMNSLSLITHRLYYTL